MNDLIDANVGVSQTTRSLRAARRVGQCVLREGLRGCSVVGSLPQLGSGEALKTPPLQLPPSHVSLKIYKRSGPSGLLRQTISHSNGRCNTVNDLGALPLERSSFTVDAQEEPRWHRR
jgi:hypothetical protein